MILAKNEGICQKKICDLLYVEKSTTAKAVKYLISKGYIYKRQIMNDKRYSSLYLTEKGREASAAVEGAFLEIIGIFSKNIPNSLTDQTIEVLKTVISNLKDEKIKYVTE
jgi:DNA-binding MarR family transcriptional regulator